MSNKKRIRRTRREIEERDRLDLSEQDYQQAAHTNPRNLPSDNASMHSDDTDPTYSRASVRREKRRRREDR